MDKKKVASAIVLLALVVGGYFIYKKLKGDELATVDVALDGGSGGDKVAEKAERVPHPLSPQGQTQVSMDDDPEGPLRLEGQVIDENDQGVGGALVTLTSNPPRTVTAEGDGTFVFEKLVGRTYALSARSGELIGGPVAYKLSGEVGPPAIIRMRAGGSVTVRVRADATGQPIAGASVELRDLDVRTAVSDKSGVAKFSGVGSGWFLVVAKASGYGAGRQALLMPSTSGASLSVELSLKPGAAIVGVVKGDAGAPLAGATVTAHRVGRAFDSVSSRYDGVKTDEAGAFRLEGVAVGKTQIVANHRDYAVGRSEILDIAGDMKGVEITLERGGLISGRVVTASGEAVPWANVAVTPEGDTSVLWGGGSRGTTADDKGAFEIKGLPLAKMNLLAKSETASSQVVDVDLKAKAKVTGLEIALEVTGTISGKVVDSDGNDVPEVQVILTPDWTSGIDSKRFALSQGDTTTTGGDGSFVFTGLDPGTFILKPTRDVGSPLFWQAEGTRAKTGDSGVELILAANGGIKGRVTTATGKAIETFTVTIGYPPGHPVSDKSGEFELLAVPPGKFDVKISGADFGRTTVSDVVVEPGKTFDVGDVKVLRGRVIAGRVLDTRGSGVAGATVLVAPQLVGSADSLSFSTEPGTDEMMRLKRGTTDEQGNFRIRGAPLTEQVIAAEHPEGGRSRPTLVAKGDADLTFTLKLQGVGSVTGIVKRGDTFAAGTNVVATPSEARLQMVAGQTDEKGVYNLTTLAAGPYEVTASFGSGFAQRTVTRKVTVKSGEKHEVDLVFVLGDVTLTVTAKPEPGAKVDATQGFLIPRKVNVETARDLYAAMLGEEASGAGQGFTPMGQDWVLKEVVPGLKTVCLLPITGDLQDAQFLQRLQEQGNDLKVVCQEVVVAESPLEQALEVVVPQMEPLPEPAPQPSP